MSANADVVVRGMQPGIAASMLHTTLKSNVDAHITYELHCESGISLCYRFEPLFENIYQLVSSVAWSSPWYGMA